MGDLFIFKSIASVVENHCIGWGWVVFGDFVNFLVCLYIRNNLSIKSLNYESVTVWLETHDISAMQRNQSWQNSFLPRQQIPCLFQLGTS